AWKALMHTMDAGTLGGDAGTWTFLLVLLFATIGGLFVVSALIGVLNQGFGQLLEQLRRGKSAVVEKDHTVILGWGPKIFTLLHELAEANKNVRNACVVILADRDKVEMDAEIAQAMKGKKLRVVTRRGSAMSMADVGLVGLVTSKAVIVLAPERDSNGTPLAPHESDTVVLKTLLAVGKIGAGANLHIVAEIFDERTEPVARLVVGDKAALILAAPLVSRLLVQTGRQSGLSVVYTELLDFEGVEIYVKEEPRLAGKTFREAVFAYGTSTVLGVIAKHDEMLLPPPVDYVLAAGDRIVAISEDDDTLILDGAGTIDDAAVLPQPLAVPRSAERTLVLGTSQRLPLVLRELDSYVAPGSETLVYGEAGQAALPARALETLQNMKVTIEEGDVTDRGLLASLDIARFDHILVLSEIEGRTQEMADARTTVTLLFLRELERLAGKKVPITSEILEIQSRDLAAVAEADDFIVSNTLVSLMVSQVAENRHLVRVFDELFTAGGYELYLKPAADYVKPGATTFGTVCESALRRSEIAIGYRLATSARDPAASYGVVVNPDKRGKVTLGEADRVIVMAES
ncbi:MAG TPA: TrkA C-terminal domain-containing protein, partial [Kofleriaceae bacterium]|nr:TrkA C-terminal domain-containing protein [Kofleriaceae bacterium]